MYVLFLYVINYFLFQLRLIENIAQHLPESYLPDTFGGSRKYSHSDWVMNCIECYKRSIEDNPPHPPRPPPLTGMMTPHTPIPPLHIPPPSRPYSQIHIMLLQNFPQH